jgi:predicted enzyme related to lactoylglutathione lyase
MPDAPLQPPNHPIWADLASPDIEASKQFYGGLFGWEAETVAPPEAGTYTLWRLDGKTAAAIQTTMDGQMPPVWRAYIHAADAAATTEKARQAGATIFMEPMDVFDSGRLAFFADPTGAAIGLWQPLTMAGAEVMFEPGSLGWIELATTDMDAAKRFYKDVFGWDSHTSEGEMPYTEWQLDGRSIAGAMTMGPQMEGVPPHWQVYFSVEDVDKSAAQVQELGGSLMVPAMDFPGGRFAIVGDPHGSTFGLMFLRR